FLLNIFFFFSSRRRHTRSKRDWSSDVCSSDLSTSGTVHRIDHFRVRSLTTITDRLRGASKGLCDQEELRMIRAQILPKTTQPNRSEERRVGKECSNKSLRA